MLTLIHDVSTDPDTPPQFIALRAVRLHCPNGVEYSGLSGPQHRRLYPRLVSADFELSLSALSGIALKVAGELGWAIATAMENHIEATVTTPLLRFKDDVVIRLCANGTHGTRLDIRSASRTGRSDLGTNARRVETFLKALKAR